MTILGLARARALTTILREAGADPKRYLRYSWAAVLCAGVLSAAVIVTNVGAFPTLASMVPTVPPERTPAQSTRLYDVKGRLIAMLHGEENRIVIPRRAIPKALIQAVLAIEDDGFYEHNGVEPSAVMRALLANTLRGDVEQGGSTITQQYVRNAVEGIGRDRSVSRKIREAVVAMRYEQLHDKDEILDAYLNTIYFGRGAYGIEAAARTYFSKPARSLRLSESAFLAGVIHAPERYVADARAARARRNEVLQRMVTLTMISRAQAAAATREPLRFRFGRSMPVRAAYFVEWVRRLLLTPVSEGGFGLTNREVLSGGLRVYTTLDLDMQSAAERAVRSVLPFKNDPEASLVAMTTDGQVRAMVGGRNFTSIERARGFNFATQIARGGGRQAGSAFKPFTLLAYVRQGYSVRKTFRAPSRITVPACPNGDRPWSPGNYGNQGFGSLSVAEATALSVNTVYAQMVALVGPTEAMRAARDSGIVSPLDPVCSLALGTFGVTALEMSRAYATISARGARPDIVGVTKVLGPDGKVVTQKQPTTVQTIEPQVADIVNKVLEGVVTSGTGRPAAIARPSAGKTGTTDERRDVWYAGYTPHPGLSTAVWIGYPPDARGRIRKMISLHGRPATGGYFAGRIWKAFMSEATAGTPALAFPEANLDAGRMSATVRVEGVRVQRRTSSRTVVVPERPKKRSEPKPKESEPPKPEPEPEPSKEPDPPPEPEPSPTPT